MPSELDLIRNLYEYNSKTRAKYLAAIWKLPPRELYRDRGASFPSVVDIFLHVLDAYRLWFDWVYAGGPTPEWYPLGQKYTLAEARREMRAIDRRVLKALAEITPGDLDRRLALPKVWRTSKRIELRVLLVHMIEEELQHRGEMNALLWQSGRDPPVTGYDDYMG
jgi:uncharacterized damage-inducible protein DinB